MTKGEGKEGQAASRPGDWEPIRELGDWEPIRELGGLGAGTWELNWGRLKDGSQPGSVLVALGFDF